MTAAGPALQTLHALARKKCSPPIWAQGTQLAGDGSVMLDREDDSEIVLAVRAPGFAVPPTVVLYPEDKEWACDCGGSADPCPHVAAALIALEEARRTGRALPSARQSLARLSYRFARANSALSLARYVVHPDGSESPLAGMLSGARAAGSVVADEDDFAVDRMLDVRPLAQLAPEGMADLLEVLSRCADVSLDGRAVTASGDTVLPRAFVDDHPQGFALRVERDPVVLEPLGRAVALCAGDVLRPLGATDLTGARLEKLPLTRTFAHADVVDLVADAIPELAARVRVEVRTRKLPRKDASIRPRVLMRLSHRGHTLSVVPEIVYGDPPVARVDGAKLIHAGRRKAVPVRDAGAETQLAQRLREALNLAPGRRVDFEGRDAVQFATRLQAWGAADATRAIFGSEPLRPRIETRDDGAFDVVFASPREGGDGDGDDDDAPERRADAAAVVRAWQEGLPLAPLDGGGWAPLPVDWLARYGHRVADLLAARGADGEVPAVAIPALAQLCDDLEHPRPPGFARLAPLLDAFESVPDATLPADLDATLRPYQRHGVNWLCFLRDAGLGALLADDMGLGKTLQTLCALRGRALVVCPRSVLHNWSDEAKRFRPSMRVAVYHGAGRALDPDADLTLTTYAVLRGDADALANEHWDVVVLDEAHAIKNPDSQVARAAYGLRAAFRVALTGTPVENRLEELWSQFHFANRGLLGGRGDFDERYAAPIAAGDAGAAERLRARVRPFLLRRLKRDVAPELPPRTDAVLRVDLDAREREVYDAVRAATRDEVVTALRAGGGGTLAALEALLRLRQAACHSALVPGQRAESSSKVERLLEALSEAAADGHKALVFSQWTGLLDLIEPHLRAADVPFVRLDGSTRDRGAVVAEFQSESGPPVMLVSLKAGGTGLNLTAADHVFLLDPWWNPAVEDQAADRAHRIGQKRSVMVYRMVAADTVEEGILALQARKRSLADAALAGADPGASLTRDDLLALLA